jgi:Flp pilus assembly protein TadG
MSPLRVQRRLAREERGGVLVMVVIWLPLLILLVTFVIDVANWFEHKRHLQMQADSAALAAAHDFRIPCADQPIIDSAQNYSGGQYNAQIGGTPAANGHMLGNSRTDYNQSSPVDDTVNTSPPCTAKMIDVKMTETDLPWYFKVAQVPFIDAHARVSILQAETFAGALPVGVPEVNPKSARVTFIDESTSPPTTLGSRDLTRTGTANGLAIWDNSGSPLPITVNTRNIGVRVALGGGTSTACGDPLVECYDAGSANGILYARGWSAAGSGAQPGPPIARDVTLFNGSCTDAYFSAAAAPCTIGVSAKVDFGTADPTTVGAKLTATVNGNDYPLTFDATSGSWQSAASIGIAPGAGPVPVTLKWEETIGNQGDNTCKTTGGNKCTGTFGTVQRAFGASDARSGPIKLAQIWENGSFWANSFEMCSAVNTSCTHNLAVKIGVSGSLEDAQSVNDPIVSLRVVGGSQNQSLDCDPALSQLKDELARGCAPEYKRNSGTACPAGNGALWATPQPWPCVGIQTGTAVNQVAAGMNMRVLGNEHANTCTSPNHWSTFPDLPSGDPRIVNVFLTPYGSFSGSGSGTVPVDDFGTFYVTGWTSQGQGFDNPCAGNGDDPVPGNNAGYIVGHFIKYIQTLNNGNGGTQPCDLNSFGACVAVLTE